MASESRKSLTRSRSRSHGRQSGDRLKLNWRLHCVEQVGTSTVAVRTVSRFQVLASAAHLQVRACPSLVLHAASKEKKNAPRRHGRLHHCSQVFQEHYSSRWGGALSGVRYAYLHALARLNLSLI